MDSLGDRVSIDCSSESFKNIAAEEAMDACNSSMPCSKFCFDVNLMPEYIGTILIDVIEDKMISDCLHQLLHYL
jgi:NADPH-dependent glutamate synthase beta subunit-like oxidoreductase